MRAGNVVCLFLAASGSIILAWVGWLTWYDMALWGKDVALIFFESRTGETISLGINVRVIHYFLMSLVLILSSLLVFHLNQSKRLHHFRCVASLPRNALILQDLIEKLVVSRLTWITISGVAITGASLYSYLRGNEAAVVGVLAPFYSIMIILLATRQNRIVTVEEEKAGLDTTSLEENPANKTMSNTVKFLDLSHTNIYLRNTTEFRMDIHSSENQITLSSHYATRRRPPCETSVYKKTLQTINSSKRIKL